MGPQLLENHTPYGPMPTYICQYNPLHHPLMRPLTAALQHSRDRKSVSNAEAWRSRVKAQVEERSQGFCEWPGAGRHQVITWEVGQVTRLVGFTLQESNKLIEIDMVTKLKPNLHKLERLKNTQDYYGCHTETPSLQQLSVRVNILPM